MYKIASRNVPIFNATVVKIEGFIDPSANKKQPLHFELEKIILSGYKSIIINVEKLMFNSFHFGVFIIVADFINERGGKCLILKASKKLRLLFLTLGIEDFFYFFNDEYQAFDFLKDNGFV
ncbi:hypothetical protein [Candidatus Uabimicrobium sp. HlEnr_7]|uniref:hypothetical protein n=1 Tax=Candidatus Uabimicrobium helgolandensis TaxID=3095367 RepID=UPI0035568671